MRVIEVDLEAIVGKKRSKYIAVRLPSYLNELLEIIARDLGIPKSALLREAVEEIVKNTVIDDEDVHRSTRKWGVILIE